MQIFQFKVSLDHIEPPVWRRFVISSDATFGKLSDVIQIVMGWNNSHLHEFFLGAEQIGMKDEDSPAEVKNENRIRLSSKLKTEEFHFRYLYDFGDDWEHSIVLERILASNDESPPLSRRQEKLSTGGFWRPASIHGVPRRSQKPQTSASEGNVRTFGLVRSTIRP